VWLERGGRLLGAKETGLAAVLVIIVLFLAWQSPNFLTAANLVVVSRQIALALFISIGMTFVILSGAIDLSVGSVVALVSVTVGQLMVTAGLQPVLATVLALVVGSLVGVFNGAVVAYTRIPSFVVTLGMLAMASGLALGMTQGQTISGFPAGFLAIGQGSTLGVPNPVWLAAVAAVVAHLVLARTTFGRHVYLLGSNEQAALLSGISVRRTKILIFTIASTLAACAGIVETARLTVGQPSAGAGYELAAIGAVVIGGASLFGGEGSILGTVLGTTLLGLILNGLILLGISAYWQQVFSGAVIILAVGLNFWRQRQRQRS
jgi:ribose/xylose/arabinose/galactoside ABC-type transport system permease subunit